MKRFRYGFLALIAVMLMSVLTAGAAFAQEPVDQDQTATNEATVNQNGTATSGDATADNESTAVSAAVAEQNAEINQTIEQLQRAFTTEELPEEEE